MNTNVTSNKIKDSTRYNIFPIENDDTWQFVQDSYAMYWVAGEIQRDLATDSDDVIALKPDEQHLLFQTLSFFATGDYIVNQNLNTSFYHDVEKLNNLEAVYFYDFQRMIENVHSHVYAMLLQFYVKDITYRQQLIDGIKNNPVIKKKAEWCLNHFGTPEQQISFPERLIAQACTELIGFSGSFCIIFWFARQNKFKGLKKANQLISRDEGLHGQFACHMYKKIGSPLQQDHVKQIINDFVNIEIEYIKYILPHKLLGLNSDNMTQYIKYMANYLMTNLNYPAIYPNITNPFDFMEAISIGVRSTDFFKKETSDYRKANSNIVDTDDLKLEFGK